MLINMAGTDHQLSNTQKDGKYDDGDMKLCANGALSAIGSHTPTSHKHTAAAVLNLVEVTDS